MSDPITAPARRPGRRSWRLASAVVVLALLGFGIDVCTRSTVGYMVRNCSGSTLTHIRILVRNERDEIALDGTLASMDDGGSVLFRAGTGDAYVSLEFMSRGVLCKHEIGYVDTNGRVEDFVVRGP